MWCTIPIQNFDTIFHLNKSNKSLPIIFWVPAATFINDRIYQLV